MGTRYEKGDIVEFESRNAKVINIMRPKSDSPIYEIELIPYYEQGEKDIELVRASEIKKVDQNFSEGDTVERYEGVLNGVPHIVMYDVLEVRENTLVVKLWGEDSKTREIRKEQFRHVNR